VERTQQNPYGLVVNAVEQAEASTESPPSNKSEKWKVSLWRRRSSGVTDQVRATSRSSFRSQFAAYFHPKLLAARCEYRPSLNGHSSYRARRFPRPARRLASCVIDRGRLRGRREFLERLCREVMTARVGIRTQLRLAAMDRDGACRQRRLIFRQSEICDSRTSYRVPASDERL